MRQGLAAHSETGAPLQVTPLAGLSVTCLSNELAAAICLLHLIRLGARQAADSGPADIVLTSAVAEGLPCHPQGTITCCFVQHFMDGGGLVGSETTAQAAIGLTDYISASGDRPARTGADLASIVTGFCATQAVLAWLLGGRRPGQFSKVELSPLRTLATLKTILIAARARPDAWTGTHVRSRDRLVDSGYATADGRITLDFPYDGHEAWTKFARTIGLGDAVVADIGDRWYETVGWGDDVDRYRGVYQAAFARMTTEHAIDMIRSHGGSSVPFLTLEQCLDHPHSQALRLRESLDVGLPWELLPHGSEPAPAANGSESDDPCRPLEGIRVLDLGVGGVGPFAGALLAWLGADVIKVEAPNEFIHAVRPLVGGLSTTYLSLNQGKRSVSLNIKTPVERERILALLANADVLMENFRPGALDRAGLGFADVRQARPGIVYASASGFGWVGPLAEQPCTDPHTQAISGFAAGNVDEKTGLPRRIRYYGFLDLVTSCVFAESILAALVLRKFQGGSIQVRTSMLHAATAAQSAHGLGPRAAFDGIFRSVDGDVAVTCRDDGELARLAELTGGTGKDTIASAIKELPSTPWTQACAAAGIPCVRVLHDDEVNSRRDYWDQGILRDLPLRHASPLAAGGPPWVFDGSVPPGPLAPYPGADEDRWLE
jgi:crotonobetainyl-CoA:carnitine CoA-transferase CaiB-like acyl-CoA transferase